MVFININKKKNLEKEAITIKNINQTFLLPITFSNNLYETPENLLNDLELTKLKENPNKCLYDFVFKPKNQLSSELLQQWNKYYTTNTLFLKDNQKLLKSLTLNPSFKEDQLNNLYERWCNIKNDKDFKEKYLYVEWDYFDFLNKSPLFLEILSLYTITSPVLSLLSPVLLLILHFFILKLNNNKITVKSYFFSLQTIFKSIPLGRIFDMKDMSFDKKIYSIISLFFYFLQIYQNTQFCIKFKKNMSYIHDFINDLNNYLKNTIVYMNNFKEKAYNMVQFSKFNKILNDNKENLIKLKKELDKVTPLKINLSKVSNIGHVMKVFYELYDNSSYEESLIYSFGFNSYLENMFELKKMINSKEINKCSFKVNKKTKIIDGYYAAINKKQAICNSYDLDKNIIITGPNAAGKTTILKSTIFNILLSQQIGFGFYKKAYINPYDYFHCYINIPDTAGRDSLFQAESRRCKQIIDFISNNSNKNHLCIFDELYSGTNPYEAVSSAYAYLKYINKFSNCKFLLTTHYIKLCNLIEDTDYIENYHMDVINDEDNFNYTYKLVKGISKIKGGIKVLHDLNYPKEIISETKSILNTL